MIRVQRRRHRRRRSRRRRHRGVRVGRVVEERQDAETCALVVVAVVVVVVVKVVRRQRRRRRRRWRRRRRRRRRVRVEGDRPPQGDAGVGAGSGAGARFRLLVQALVQDAIDAEADLCSMNSHGIRTKEQRIASLPTVSRHGHAVLVLFVTNLFNYKIEPRTVSLAFKKIETQSSLVLGSYQEAS